MDNSTKLIQLRRAKLNLERTKEKLMEDKDQELRWQWIQEILEEAGRWGLRGEVEMFAQKFMQENPELDEVVAYQNAFNEWVK